MTINTIEDTENKKHIEDSEDKRKKEGTEPETEKAVHSVTGRKKRRWYFRLFLCVSSFLIVLGLILLAFRSLGLEPFGSRTLTVDDAKIQYIDFFTYYVDVLHGVRPLSYDFGNMLGGSSFGLFSYYLASPFNLLLYFFGKEGVYRFFNIAVALKLATAGATFCWYLQRRFEDRILPVFTVALSIGYALMQYTVAQSSNIMWLDGVYMLPLILLGVYEVLHRRSVWRLVLAVAACIVCNWYIAGICCLFSGIWFVFEFFFRDSVNRKRPPVQGLDRPGRRQQPSRLVLGVTDFVVSFCRYVWGMGLGVAASAVLFLPAVSAMRQGKGQYEEIEILMGMKGNLLSAITGYTVGRACSPNFAALFCGGIAVSAALALLFSGAWKIRQKTAFVLLGGVCFLMLHWEPARLAFSLFKRADSYWYRYSFLVCFALLFGAGAWLSRAEQDRVSRALVVPLAILFGAAVLWLNGIRPGELAAEGMAYVHQHRTAFLTVGSSFLLSVLTLLLLSVKPAGSGRAVRFIAGLLLLVITGTEMWANAWFLWRWNTNDSRDFYLEYSEGLQDQLAQLRAVDQGAWRIAQDRTRWHYEDDDLTSYFNDALAQNYWSNTAYTSSPENAQLSLMWRLGYRDEAGCMMIVRDPILGSDSFLGIKYMLQSTPIQGLERVEEVDSFSGRSVYRNPFALPMAFVYSGEKLPTMRYENTFLYQNQLFSTLSGRKTQIYFPLGWTRYDEGNKAYFRIYVPKNTGAAGAQADSVSAPEADAAAGAGTEADGMTTGGTGVVVYGNLLWPEKRDGLLSINGAEPFGYDRWMSPACFLIRSREEQARSEAAQSLQAAGDTEKEQNPASTDLTEEEELKKELADAAADFDRETVASMDREAWADVRTVVFQPRNKEGEDAKDALAFKDYQFYGLDLEALGDAAERIRSAEVRDLTIENGHITCSLEGRQGRSLCLLVPWSKGWQALRNGEPVQPDTVAGTMITIPLVDGKNEIELKYQIPYLREGIYISAAALAVMLIDGLCRLIASRKRRR